MSIDIIVTVIARRPSVTVVIMSEMIKNTLLSIITILIIIVVTILARQEEEAECDRHEFIAVSYTAPVLALDEDEDKDIDYSSA